MRFRIKWSEMTPLPGRPPVTWESALETFLKKKRINQRTRTKYRCNYKRFFVALDDAGLDTRPTDIGEREINYLLDVAWKGLEVSTREWYTKLMSMFLKRYGNDIVTEMGISFPTDQRVNVDWLDPMDMVSLLDADLTPLQMLVIHLELCVGLRRVECIRLRMKDIHSGYFDIRGKGEDAGKWRTVPFHPDTPKILKEWYAERNLIITEARRYKPFIDVPETLIIWTRYKKKVQLGSYNESGDALDDQVKCKVRDTLGLSFANHTLRRTCGRMMWKSEHVQLETIAQIYGHSNTDVTKDYIGVNLDDMSTAMTALSSYQNELRKQKRGN